MANTIKVDIVSAESDIWAGAATMVFAPAEMGEIGVAPRHAPLLTRLGSGEVRVQQENGDELYFYVSGGIIEVQPHHVTVLADTAAAASRSFARAAGAASTVTWCGCTSMMPPDT